MDILRPKMPCLNRTYCNVLRRLFQISCNYLIRLPRLNVYKTYHDQYLEHTIETHSCSVSYRAQNTLLFRNQATLDRITTKCLYIVGYKYQWKVYIQILWKLGPFIIKNRQARASFSSTLKYSNVFFVCFYIEINSIVHVFWVHLFYRHRLFERAFWTARTTSEILS